MRRVCMRMHAYACIRMPQSGRFLPLAERRSEVRLVQQVERGEANALENYQRLGRRTCFGRRPGLLSVGVVLWSGSGTSTGRPKSKQDCMRWMFNCT